MKYLGDNCYFFETVAEYEKYVASGPKDPNYKLAGKVISTNNLGNVWAKIEAKKVA